jgi:uncharacterized membrane protein
MNLPSVFVTTFLASAVEVIEMVIIVVGVGSVRGWRSTWLGAAAGLGVLAVVVAVLGTALSLVPIDLLRLVVGALLLIFGLQWLRKGINRVSANGFRGMGARSASDEDIPDHGVDWTSFVLSFKGVLLEGLEIALIVVTFGATAQAYPTALLGAVAAFIVIAGAGLLARGSVQRIPRSVLQLLVGTLLSSFGTFWAVEGVGLAWPGGDAAILGLVAWYVVTGGSYVAALRHRNGGVPAATVRVS